MRHLDEVVRGDVPADVHHFAANFARERFLDISVALVLLPVLRRKHFEVFKDVDVGVLPDGLDCLRGS